MGKFKKIVVPKDRGCPHENLRNGKTCFSNGPPGEFQTTGSQLISRPAHKRFPGEAASFSTWGLFFRKSQFHFIQSLTHCQ